MNLYEKILLESKAVDNFWKQKTDQDFSQVKINFGKYALIFFENFSTFVTSPIFPKDTVFLVDKNLDNLNLESRQSLLQLEASESKTKNIDFINNFILENKDLLVGKTLIAVGGGVILDTALCVAQILNLEIILVPTTILSMSDSSIGGKARANKVVVEDGGQVFLKHFYRANYDPKAIIVCQNFLETLPDKAIPFSCAEIIKHAFFQSESLLEFLLSQDFDPFVNKKSLMKAILWMADLKRICMEVDPAESTLGSKDIIREGHEFADKKEKESGFTISHGQAVLLGIRDDLKNTDRLQLFEKICQKLGMNLD